MLDSGMREQPDRPLTGKGRLRLALTLCALAGVAALTTCCAGSLSALLGQHQAEAKPLGLRTPDQQYEAGVIVAVSCGQELDEPFSPIQTGSGVIVAGTRVITALHVVTCPLGLAVQVKVDPGDGTMRDAVVELTAPTRDVARLVVSADLSQWFTPVAVGPTPLRGERVCWAAWRPRPTYRCATVEWTNPEWVVVDGFVEQGNSGAGLYDAAGRLVGVMARTKACQTGVFCVGGAQRFTGLEFLVP